MYQKERTDAIYNIIKENGYVTVKYLVEEMHYSNATINRDLNILEKQALIKRSYGGAEIVEQKEVPLIFRYHKMKAAKNKLGKKAAELICDGDTVFIDGSTTTESIGKYITNKKDITVITNNLALVVYLSEFNVHTICLGGHVVEIPYMLGGQTAVENAMKYHADKAFFSTGVLSLDGKIGSVQWDTGNFRLLHQIMVNNSKMNCCMMDHEKIGIDYKSILCSVDDVDYLISDYKFDKNFCERFKNTEIITVR